MMSLYMIQRRVEKLEILLLTEESKDEDPIVDYKLFTEKEKDISDTIHLFHDIAVRLGHGELRACQYRIPYESDPNSNEEAREEAICNATPEEIMRIELEGEIWQKWIHLTPLLTEEEKAAIKEYNKAMNFFGSSLMMNGAEKGWWKGYSEEELDKLRAEYEEIMAKYGEKSYENSDMKPYVAGSGIPIEVLRKMDSTMANALEAKLR